LLRQAQVGVFSASFSGVIVFERFGSYTPDLVLSLLFVFLSSGLINCRSSYPPV